MKIIKNDKLIERNGKIGNWVSLSALAVLGLGLYLSFTRPEYFSYSILCLLLGFIMTQIGMYMGNRWGRSPRPDEKIDASLKGLHSEFNIFHYVAPAPHFLVGPAGAWVLLPYQQRGKVEYRKNRWRLSGGGFLQTYMRIFGQEGLGRPEVQAEVEINSVRKALAKSLDENSLPEINAIILFTNDDVEVNSGDSPIQGMKLKQLKEFLREKSKNRILYTSQIEQIASVFAPST